MRSRGRTDAAERRLRTALGDRPVAGGLSVSLLAEPLPWASAASAQESTDASPPGEEGSLLTSWPPAVRGGVFDPRRHGAIALAGLAVLGALAAGVVAWRARPSATRVPRPIHVAGSAAGTSSPGANKAGTNKAGTNTAGTVTTGPGTAGPGTTGSSGPSVLVIDVEGDVRKPGLRRLPAGSRVADALAAAGGIKPGTAPAGLNLARKLVDGEQVVVSGERPSGAQQLPAGAAAAASAAATADQPLDLNAATVGDLDTLSGLGPVLAQRIITWRDAHGGFSSVDQLREIEGIGDRKFASLRAQVTV